MTNEESISKWKLNTIVMQSDEISFKGDNDVALS